YARGRTIDTVSGPVRIINSDTAGEASLELGGSGSRPAELRLFDTSGSETVELRGGTAGGRLTISGFGGFPFIRLDPGDAGDAAVELPQNSISALEMLNEPGVANSVRTSTATVGGSQSIIVDRQINCPTNGFVLAIATAEATVDHTFLFQSSMIIGITEDDDRALNGARDISVDIPGAAAGGIYRMPVTVHGLYPVEQGSNGFALEAQGNASFQLRDINLTLLFVPTSYGNTDPLRTGPTGQRINAASQHTPTNRHLPSQLDMQHQLDTLRNEIEQLKQAIGADTHTDGDTP
ncbi:MAG: hypothetical protein AAFO89_06005, partial [Planctomycetota bacterium]